MDLSQKIATRVSVGPQAIAGGATVEGEAVDISSWHFADVHALIGAAAPGADATLSVEESADGVAWTPVADADGVLASGTVPAGQTNITHRIALDAQRRQQFLRGVFVNGAGGAADVCVMIMLGHSADHRFYDQANDAALVTILS